MAGHGELILLVDDEDHLLVTLRDFFTFNGYSVEVARSAEEALKKLKKIAPDLIILDISMPGMGGLGFLRETMGEGKKLACPVLVLTARANMREFFGAIDVAGFVAKPCAKSELLGRVEAVLESKKPAPAPQEKKSALHVLLGEDDTNMADVIRRTFERSGHRVTIADAGPRVLDAALADRPDVVVVCEVLTRMNGEAVASLLRSMPSTSGIPIVLYNTDESTLGGTDRAAKTAIVDRHLVTCDSMDILGAVQDLLPTAG